MRACPAHRGLRVSVRVAGFLGKVRHATRQDAGPDARKSLNADNLSFSRFSLTRMGFRASQVELRSLRGLALLRSTSRRPDYFRCRASPPAPGRLNDDHNAVPATITLATTTGGSWISTPYTNHVRAPTLWMRRSVAGCLKKYELTTTAVASHPIPSAMVVPRQ